MSEEGVVLEIPSLCMLRSSVMGDGLIASKDSEVEVVFHDNKKDEAIKYLSVLKKRWESCQSESRGYSKEKGSYLFYPEKVWTDVAMSYRVGWSDLCMDWHMNGYDYPIPTFQLLPDGVHHIIVSFETVAPFAGCYRQQQFLIFKVEVNGGSFSDPHVEYIFAPGKCENAIRRDCKHYEDMSWEKVMSILKRDVIDSEIEWRHVHDNSRAIHETYYHGVSSLSEDADLTGTAFDYPFLWDCSQCGSTRDDTVSMYLSSRGLGGVGSENNDPMCASCMENGRCAEAHDEFCREKMINGGLCSTCLNCTDCGVNIKDFDISNVHAEYLKRNANRYEAKDVFTVCEIDRKIGEYVSIRTDGNVRCSACVGKQIYKKKMSKHNSTQIKLL